MHHPLSKPDYLQEVNEAMIIIGPVRRYLSFDKDFVLIESDWANGTSPEDVARRIAEGTHDYATKSEFYAF